MNKQRNHKSNIARWHWIVLLVAIAAIAVVALRPGAQRVNYTHFTAAEDTIVRTISGVGRVTPLYQEMMLASTSAQISRVLVAVGDTVERDAVLLRTSTGAEMRSPIAGEVSALHVSVNQWVTPGSRLVEVTNFVDLEIAAQVDELDVAKITTGQTATIDIIALTGDSLTGPITRIGRSGTTAGGITTFAVGVALPPTDGAKLGMSAEIRVEVARAESVTVVPVAAVQYDGDTPFVLVHDGERNYRRVDITTGLSDGELVEVRSGITTGQVVAFQEPVSETNNFGPGMRGGR